MELTPAAEESILTRFGIPALREGQRELLSIVLAGRAALGVLPTGHGKSLVYQAAAQLLGGVSVVISPLIALMRDQCESLQRRGIPAARFDSTLEDDEKERVLDDIRRGRLTLLFAAPESLENHELNQALAAAELCLFVVDEAHCVSEWGHSFRPDYLRLPAWKARFRFRSTLALTATATPRVRQDLCRAFQVEAADCIVLSPYRPNIRRRCIGTSQRTEALLHYLNGADALPAIVYCRTRKETEGLAAELQQRGYAAACYHAGQPAELRARLQDDFLHNRLSVLVATIAFGMGVDKPDVRSVVHYSMPGSPESYLQESGRGGRDGAPCTSLVLLDATDEVDARNRLKADEPDAAGVLRCVRWLLPAVRRVVSPWELTTSCDVAEDVLQRALQDLTEESITEIEARGFKFYKVKPLFPLNTITDGRSAEEKERLRWLDAHREEEVENAAAAWDCPYAEAMDFLRDCEAAGEWKLSFRQRALCLHTIGTEDARATAEALSAAYARRRRADEARLSLLLGMLTGGGCLNQALEQYFMGEAAVLPPCGHCPACCADIPRMPDYERPERPQPTESEMPPLERDSQRRRFLLGLSSPGLMARRAWSHPLYGLRAGLPWEEV